MLNCLYANTGSYVSYCFILFNILPKHKEITTLQSVILVSLAVVAVIQNMKFFYLIFFPSFEILPFIGKPLIALIPIPSNFKLCLELVGSDFDHFNLALGRVAVIWLSIKQILEAPYNKKKQSSKQSSSSSNQNPPTSNP